MCGIAGFTLVRQDNLDARRVSRVLLNQIVTRGTDATGCSWVTRDNGGITIRASKAPVAAQKFNGYQMMKATTRSAILHTRYATKGHQRNSLNNHPITSGPITGVHNGHLSNDDELFAETGASRRGQVDSEAAMALLASTKGHPTTVLPDLRGRAALAWFDARDRTPTLHLARCCDSPLCVAQTPAGSLLFASTQPLLLAAMRTLKVKAEFVQDVAEGTYLRVRNGRIIECQTFAARPATRVRDEDLDAWWEGDSELAAVAAWEADWLRRNNVA